MDGSVTRFRTIVLSIVPSCTFCFLSILMGFNMGFEYA